LGKVAWKDVILAGWPVLSVLLLMSLITLAVAWERWRVFSKIKENTGAFLKSMRSHPSPQKVLQWCEKSDQPLALITGNIFKSGGQRDAKDRSLQRSIQILVQKYEDRINVLGTIASVSPFVGLLGTVIGIISAFRAISMTQGGASAVAVGIAEALMGTAGGLIVAIPALLLYNYFVNKLRRHTQEWEIVGGEIIDLSLAESGSH